MRAGKPQRAFHRSLILLILALAALLRFSARDLIQFHGDQAATLSLARAAFEAMQPDALEIPLRLLPAGP